MSSEAIAAPGAAPRRDHILVGCAALLTFVSLFFEGPEWPAEDATAEQVRAHVESNLGGIGLQVFGESLAFLGVVLLTVGLRALGRGRGGEKVMLDLALVAGALTAVWFWFQAAVDMVPLVATDDDGRLDHYADGTVLAMDLVNRIGETFGDLSTVPRGLFLLAVSLVVLRTRMLPRWTGWFGLVVAAASLLAVVAMPAPSAVGSVTWFVGLFGFVLWLLVVGVTSLVQALRRPRQARVADQDVAAG
jgi:hypothetical protein